MVSPLDNRTQITINRYTKFYWIFHENGIDLLYSINSSKNAAPIYNHVYYRQVSNISRTLVGDQIVKHSDVVGASPVGADPDTSSFST